MGKPEDTESFEEIIVDDIVIFVEKNILDAYVEKNMLLINIEGYGRFPLEIICDK